MKRFLALALVALLACASLADARDRRVPVSAGNSAVALDVNMSSGNASDGLNQECLGLPCTSTGITVTAAATILVATVHCQGDVGEAEVTGFAMTWNASSMTQGAFNNQAFGSPSLTAIYYILSPAAGANTLALTYTGTGMDCYMGATSFKNATGINAGDTVIPDLTSVGVTSDANGATVACVGTNGAAPTMNFNKLWDDDPNNPGAGCSYQLGGSTNSHTFTGMGGTTPLGAGIHIVN